MNQIYYHYVDSLVGKFLIAGTDVSLCNTGFTTGHQQRQPASDWKADPAPLKYAIGQFEAYFEGEKINFDIPLSPIGTPFQQEVWRLLQSIKFGQTASYGQIAKLAGKPNASRAIGAANRANHLPLVIPCHRIIGADGSLTGFGGGLDTKLGLLQHEGAPVAPYQPDLLALI